VRHWLILALWGAIYYVPMLLPSFNSALFYSSQILFSALLAFGLLWIDERYPGRFLSFLMVVCLFALTSTFALFNLFTQIGYLIGNHVLHDVYSPVSNGINTLELVVLGLGITIGLYQDGRNTGHRFFGSVGHYLHVYLLVRLFKILKVEKWTG